MREHAERDDVDAGFFCKLIESLCSGGLRRGQRDTSEAAKSNGAGGFEVEVVLREKNAGAGFGDEGCQVGKAAECGIELKAVASGDPNTGNAFAGEMVEKVWETQKRSSGERDEIVDGAVDDGGGRAHAGKGL